MRTTVRYMNIDCNLQDRRLQWKIPWRVCIIFCTVALLITELVLVESFVTKMGVKVKRAYAREYIPFGRVLANNFLLHEEIADLKHQLSMALNTVSDYYFKCETFMREIKVFKERNVLIEDLVQTMEDEKQKTKAKIQENV